MYGLWVVLILTIAHCTDEDVLDPENQRKIRGLISAGCILLAGMAPECSSFSRAVTPAVRSREHPFGLSAMTEKMRVKVEDEGQGRSR